MTPRGVCLLARARFVAARPFVLAALRTRVISTQRNHGKGETTATKTAPRIWAVTPLKVFAKYYRHTEGVGEMYEDRARWFFTSARSGFPPLVYTIRLTKDGEA
jgi:hypothetical protein